jgi:hexulose-6-phosphate isomerase
MARIGIMQGRLLPPVQGRIQRFPRDGWFAEFPFAAKAGIETIEWIYETYGMEVNPLATVSGISRITALSDEHGVRVLSLCADYFMEKPLVRTSGAERDERLRTLSWLVERCGALGINRIVIPFVDSSGIETEADADAVVSAVKRILPDAEKSRVEIHLETSLPPEKFARLLERLPHPMVKANYDSGNSASLGYVPQEEFAAYGSRVGSVHIKDRVRGGGTVALGTGDVNFPGVFSCLEKVRYNGDYVLQVARGKEGDEANWALHNREFVARYLDRSWRNP